MKNNFKQAYQMKIRKLIKSEHKSLQNQVQRATRSQTTQIKQKQPITQTKKKGNEVRNNFEGIEPPQRKQVRTQFDGTKKQSLGGELNEKSVLEALNSLKNNKDNVSYEKLNQSLKKNWNIDEKEHQEQINMVLDSLQKDFLIDQQKSFIHLNNEEEIQLDQCKDGLLDEEDNLSIVPDQAPTQVNNQNQFKDYMKQESTQVIIQTALKKQHYESLFSKKPIIKELHFQWNINVVQKELELLNLAIMDAQTENTQFGSKEGKLIKLSIVSIQNKIGVTKEMKKLNPSCRQVLLDKHFILLQNSVFAFSRLRYLSLSIYSHKDTLNEIEKNEKLLLSEPFEVLRIVFLDKKVKRVRKQIQEKQGIKSLSDSFHGQCRYNLLVCNHQIEILKENHDNKQIKLIQDRATKLNKFQYFIRQAFYKTDDYEVLIDTLSNAHAIRKVYIQSDILSKSLIDSYPCLDKDYPELYEICIRFRFQLSELDPDDDQRRLKIREQIPKILDRHLDHVIALKRQPDFNFYYRICSQTNEIYMNHIYQISTTYKQQYLELSVIHCTYIEPLRRLLSETLTFAGFYNYLRFRHLGDFATQAILTLIIDVLNQTQEKIKIKLLFGFCSNLKEKTSQLFNKLIMVASHKCTRLRLILVKTSNHLKSINQVLTPFIRQCLRELCQVKASNFVLDISVGQKQWGILKLFDIQYFLIMIMFLKFNLTINRNEYSFGSLNFLQSAQEGCIRMKMMFLFTIHQSQTLLQLKLKRQNCLIRANNCVDVFGTLKSNKCFFSDVIKSYN